MKKYKYYSPQTGQKIEELKPGVCYYASGDCELCPLSYTSRGDKISCEERIKKNPDECAKLLGFEIFDSVNHPEHYTQGDIECIDAIKAATTGLTGIEAYSTGAAMKYIWRWKWKNGAEDIKKAIWYLERILKEMEE